MPNVVLTAGHCLHDFDPRNLIVVAGNVNSTLSPENIFQISSISHPHFSYTQFAAENDLGLVFLKSCIPNVFHFPKLPSGAPDDSGDIQCDSVETVGFGRHEQIPNDYYVPDQKLRILTTNQYIHSREVCETAFSNHLLKTEFKNKPVPESIRSLITSALPKSVGCYGGDEDAIPSGYPCVGDSGGPVISKTSNTLVGVTSFSSEICGTIPNYYTRIGQYAQWIKSEIGRKRRGSCDHDPVEIFNKPLPVASRSLRHSDLPTSTRVGDDDVLSEVISRVGERCAKEFDGVTHTLNMAVMGVGDVRRSCVEFLTCVSSFTGKPATELTNQILAVFPTGVADMSLHDEQRKLISRLLLCSSEYELFYESFSDQLDANASYMNTAPANIECKLDIPR